MLSNKKFFKWVREGVHDNVKSDIKFKKEEEIPVNVRGEGLG